MFAGSQNRSPKLQQLIPSDSDPDYPFSFRVARTLHTLLSGLRGEYFFYSLLGKFNSLDRAGRFEYFGGKVYIPLRVPEALYVNDFSLFQGLREVNFAHQLNSMFDEFVLLDCGGYFAQVSMRIAKLCPGLENTVIFDPNSENCVYARANLELTGKPFKVINAAVSDFSGNATLIFPEGPNVPDSAYIEKCEDGDIGVLRLDDLLASHSMDLSGKNVAIKLDVEGQEKAAVKGAERVIREARAVCFFMELHPGVLKRTGQTAESLLQSVSEIRHTDWYVADQPDLKLMPGAPVFEQIGEERIVDIIGVAK
jgi:FkbM family methyltransferase